MYFDFDFILFLILFFNFSNILIVIIIIRIFFYCTPGSALGVPFHVPISNNNINAPSSSSSLLFLHDQPEITPQLENISPSPFHLSPCKIINALGTCRPGTCRHASKSHALFLFLSFKFNVLQQCACMPIRNAQCKSALCNLP